MSIQAEYDFSKFVPKYPPVEVKKELVKIFESGVHVWNEWIFQFKDYLVGEDIHFNEITLDFSGMEISNIERNQLNLQQLQRKGITGYIFPFAVIFNDVKFLSPLFFIAPKFESLVQFSNCEFHDQFYFAKAEFKGHFSLSNCRFANKFIVGFSEVNSVVFEGVSFLDEASFVGNKVKGSATFNNVSYECLANFGGTVFLGNVGFSSEITGNEHKSFFGEANFEKCEFHKIVTFNNMIFQKRALFSHGQFGSLVFDNVNFIKNIPDLRYTKIKTNPILSGMVLPKKFDESEGNTERYQKIRKFAVDDDNHEKEVELFGYELEAVRRQRIKAIDRRKSPLSFVLNHLAVAHYSFYKWFSNYGQSVGRPVLGLFVFWVIFAIFVAKGPMVFSDDRFPVTSNPTLDRSLNLSTSYDCRNVKGNDSAIWNYSFYYSAQTLSPIQLGTDQENEKTVFCLFNSEVPSFWYKLISGVMKVIGLTLIFLFGLGIRNIFKIR